MNSLNWLDWSNPVSFWWIFLVSVSFINISFWIWTKWYTNTRPYHADQNDWISRSVVWLSLIYVVVCAFRSVLPRADVQRIVLFDTFWSSVFVGRSVATVAELAFVAQWAIVLNRVATITKSEFVRKLSQVIVPLIAIAECFSWYAVIRTHYFGNSVEESLWGVTYTLIAICLVALFPKFKGSFQYIIGFSIVSSLIYVGFMATVDVPMYIGRLMQDNADGKVLLGFSDGIHDLLTRWVVTHNIQDWKEEIPWMSLYFSVAVWTSLALCYVPLNKHRLQRFMKH